MHHRHTSSPGAPGRRTLTTGTRTLAGAMAAALATALAIAVAPAAHAQNPYQRGPAPTLALLQADTGPFATAEVAVTGQRGFGGGRIYYPTDTSEGTFGAVAIVPGFFSPWSALSWMGPRIASHGFVVIGVETNSGLDFPPSRGDQLLAALDYLAADTRVNSRLDASRAGVAGHSMGGGGTLEAANDRPALQAAVPLAAWHTTKSWPNVRVPTLVVAGENDTVASPASHSEPFYTSLTAAPERAYWELDNASHGFPVSNQDATAVAMVSWLKRFVDDDTRYDQFLCPAPQGVQVQEYRNTCPNS